LKPRARVITVSDGVAAGTRVDKSGQALRELLHREGFEVAAPEIVPDEQSLITDAIVAAVVAGADVVVTTGGTGLGPRDVTPQATSMLIDYEVPGLAELMRRNGERSTPMAVLSRGVVGVRGHSLIVNVPGSTKGATESLEAVLPVLGHAIQLLHGDTRHE
jgi:molybdopterin adenylyltransferase